MSSTTYYSDIFFLVTILVPLIFAVIVPFFSYKDNLYSKVGVITALCISLSGSIVSLYNVYTKGPYSYYFGGWTAPWGIEFRVDFLSLFIATIILSIGLLVAIFSLTDLYNYLNASAIPRYYSLYLLLVFSLLGITFTNDLFNLFVFIEISTLAACSLVTIMPKKHNIEAGLKYLVLSSLGSGCILLAIAFIYMVTGNLNMTAINAEIAGAWQLYPRNILAASSFLIVGFSVKSAIFPLHVWLPDVYSSAPSPSSAILSGTVTKVYAIAMMKILFGVFGLNILDVLPITSLFLVLASFSIIFGSVFAIAQGDIKRMLAYSSVSQIGYVYLGIDLASHAGLSGALLHVLNHAIMKVGLFLVVSMIVYKTGKRRIIDMKGLAYDMPITMVCFSIFALAMIGIPPLNGFFSKWYLALGALEASRPIYVVIILISSLLNAIYYLPIIISSFFYEKDKSTVLLRKDRVPNSMLFPVVLLALSCVFFGLFHTLPLNVIEKAVTNLLGKF